MAFSKLIYEVILIDKETEMDIQQEYFLTRRGAMKFIEKHSKEIEERNLKWIMGGKQLWI